MPSPAKPLTLREGYDVYKAKGHIGRVDMIGMIVEAIEDLRSRIGAVDEAAVAELYNRVSAMEILIGNALIKSSTDVMRTPLTSMPGAGRRVKPAAKPETA